LVVIIADYRFRSAYSRKVFGFFRGDYISIGIDNDALTLEEPSSPDTKKGETIRDKWLPIYDKKMRDKMLSRQKKSQEE